MCDAPKDKWIGNANISNRTMCSARGFCRRCRPQPPLLPRWQIPIRSAVVGPSMAKLLLIIIMCSLVATKYFCSTASESSKPQRYPNVYHTARTKLDLWKSRLKIAKSATVPIWETWPYKSKSGEWCLCAGVGFHNHALIWFNFPNVSTRTLLRQMF